MYLSKLLTLVLALFVGALTAVAGTSQIIPFATVDGGVGSTALFGLSIDGTNAYMQLSLGNGVQVVRINDIGGAQIRTQLVSPATWLAASGQSGCSSMQGFDLSGTDYVQFGDTSSDEIWRVNKTTGLLIKYCDKRTISNLTGRSTVSVLAVQCVNPTTGEHVFYESASRTLLITGGSNVCSILVNSLALTNSTTGLNDVPNGGMNYDNSGNLFIGSGDGSLYKLDSGGTISMVISLNAITNLTLNTSSFFGSMKMGPDGYFYYRNGSGSNGNLLRFKPTDPVGTHELFVNAATLVAAVGNANLACIRYYGTYPDSSSGWAWTRASGSYGVYLTAVPEPALFGLVGLAALLIRRFV